MPKRRRRIVGLDPVWVLAKRFRKDEWHQHPTQFLIDWSRFPGVRVTTGDVSGAQTWHESSGPRQFLRRHPELRKLYFSYRVGGMPAPAKKRKSS